jgi:hypothetical protein
VPQVVDVQPFGPDRPHRMGPAGQLVEVAACPIGQSTPGICGHLRTARYQLTCGQAG